MATPLKKIGANGFRFMVRSLFFPLITCMILGLAFHKLAPLFPILFTVVLLVRFFEVVPIARQLFLFENYLLLSNRLYFWEPKLRYDIQQIADFRLHLNPVGYELSNFKIILNLIDGRSHSYLIYDYNWQAVKEYIQERGVNIQVIYPAFKHP